MCLIYVIDNFHRLWCIHTARQIIIRPKKNKSNLSAKRSTLKSGKYKTSPITPDFLYNILVFLKKKKKIEIHFPKKLHLSQC
jgi:hypothetical protein